MENLTCTYCVSTKIIPNTIAFELTGGGPLAVCVKSNPEAIVFKGKHTGYLNACICGDCGNAELYVDNASELYAAYVKSLQTADA